MNKKIMIMYILGMFFQGSFLEASAQASGQNFVDGMKSFGNSVAGMFEGMGSMFGVVPPGYQCNWEVINDTDLQINIYYQNFISVMGGFFQTADSSASDSLHAVKPHSATFSYTPGASTPPATPSAKGSSSGSSASTSLTLPGGSSSGTSSSSSTTLALPGASSSSSSDSSSASDTSSSSSSSTTPPPPPPPTSGLYNGVKYYFALFMGYSPAGSVSTQGTNFYKEYQLNLGRQGDNSVSYYHVYTGKRFVNGHATHMTMVEMAGGYNPDLQADNAKNNLAFSATLGQVSPDSKATPAGSVYFYNTTAEPVHLTVTLQDKTKYVDISLDPFSYNWLSCPSNKTINGSTLAFASSSSAAPFKTLTVPQITIKGNNYIFEIYQDFGQSGPNVCIQGFLPGNYDICVSSNMRDISPQQAILWIQSVAQKNAQIAGQPAPKQDPTDYDLPGQIWMVYQSPSSTVMQKVALGKPTALHFTRPSLADEIGYLYFIYVNTNSDTKAQKFIANFLSGACGAAIKQQAITVINTPLDLQAIQTAAINKTVTGLTAAGQMKAISSGNAKGSVSKNVTLPKQPPIVISSQLAQEVLSGQIPANIARVQDTATNLNGYLLGIDVFTPFGGTSPALSYYQLNPATVVVQVLTQIIQQYLPSSTAATPVPTSDVINTQILGTPPQTLGWLQDYIKDPKSVQASIVAFLLQYPPCDLFDNKAVLTPNGQRRIASFSNGLVSLANPPILYSPIITQPVPYLPPANMNAEIKAASSISAGAPAPISSGAPAAGTSGSLTIPGSSGAAAKS